MYAVFVISLWSYNTTDRDDSSGYAVENMNLVSASVLIKDMFDDVCINHNANQIPAT
ncbi:hypothetical protein O9992_04120 [Vibrio lentus]|nr:hypothetical protein [Vibrio lentus]